MKKDAFYFPHFCNARHDRKIKRVVKELGVEGYGIYFMLLEVLREQTDFKFPMDDIDLLADEFGTSEQKVRTVICNYQLFDVDEQHRFFSMKLVFYLQPYLEKSERARIAANTRWEATKQKQLKEPNDANAYANAEQMECDSNAYAMQVKETKESKESKEINNRHVFDHWQSKNIHVHKELSDTIKKQLNNLTKKQVEEVIQAIDNYSTALFDKNYYYNHVWTLDKFIKQSNGYKEWVEEGGMWVAYCEKQKHSIPNQQKQSNSARRAADF